MRVSTLAKFRAGGILTFAFVVVVLSIVGLLMLLWIELTNPGLLEPASADLSPNRSKTYFGCLPAVMTRAGFASASTPASNSPYPGSVAPPTITVIPRPGG
jgi:hypothetical protein